MPGNANGEYINRGLGWIKGDVKTRFDKIDKLKYRDDQEIYQAGWEMAKVYKEQMLSAKHLLVKKDQYIVDKNGKAVLFKKGNDYWNHAAKFLDEAINKFLYKYNNVKPAPRYTLGLTYISDSEEARLIEEVAKDLDKAEDYALLKIRDYCNPMQESKNAEYHSLIKKDNNGTPKVKNGKIETQEPMYKLNDKTGYLTFTSRCNPLKVDKAVSGLFKHMRKNKKGQFPGFQIDYSNCKSENVKKNMKNKTGGYVGSLYYNSDKGKYYIIGNNDVIIDATKIGIYEGVKMKRKEIFVDEAREKERERKEELGKVKMKEDGVSPEKDPEMKNLVDQIPEKLRNVLKNNLTVSEYRRFIIETEKRLTDIAREKVGYGYELHYPPVSDSLKINLIDGNSEHSVDFEAETTLGKDIWKKIKDKKGEYKEYLTKRIQSKWAELGELRYVDLSNDFNPDRLEDNMETNEKNLLSSDEISQINTGISMLEEWFNALRAREGNSHIDNEDQAYAEVIIQLKDLRYKVNNFGRMVNKEEIIGKINDVSYLIEAKFNHYRVNRWNKGVLKDFFNEILRPGASIEKKYKIIRQIDTASFGNSGTTEFLARYLLENRSDVKLSIEDENINKCFKNIDKCLSVDNVEISEDGKIKSNENTRRIDKLYACSDSQSIAQCLVEFGIFPAKWKDDKKVKEKCQDLYKFLQRRKSEISSVNISSVKNGIELQQQKLQAKSPRSTEEEKVLKKLNSLLGNNKLLDKYCEISLNSSKDMLKYTGINDEIAVTFGPIFGDKGGGMVEKGWGSPGYIFNDIQGYGFFNLSDKNAAIVQKIAVDLIITTLISLPVGAILSTIGSLCANLIQKSATIAKWVERIRAVLQDVKIVLDATWEFGGRAVDWLGRRGIELCKNTLNSICTSAIKNYDVAELGLKTGILTLAIGTLAAGIGTFGKKIIASLKQMKQPTQAFIESCLEKGAKSGLNSLVGKSGNDYTLTMDSKSDDEFKEIFGNEKLDLSSIKFFGKYISSSGVVAEGKQLNTNDLLAGIVAISEFKKLNPSLYSQYKSGILNGTYVVAFGKSNKVYLKDVRQGGKTVLFKDLCSNKRKL